MSDRPLIFFIARMDGGHGVERFDCPLYPALEFGWSYAPLRFASDDPAAFANLLAQDCDSWARLQLELEPRTAPTGSGLVWATAAAVEPHALSPADHFAALEQELEAAVRSDQNDD